MQKEFMIGEEVPGKRLSIEEKFKFLVDEDISLKKEVSASLGKVFKSIVESSQFENESSSDIAFHIRSILDDPRFSLDMIASGIDAVRNQ